LKLIPDSSFFICFFDDLDYRQNPLYQDFLAGIFQFFSVHIVPAVAAETLAFEHMSPFNQKCHSPLNVEIDSTAESLKLILGKGEFEVIHYSNSLLKNGDLDFLFILDDKRARDIVRSFFQNLLNHMTGTIGIIEYCAAHRIHTPQICIRLLYDIQASGFRADATIIQNSVHKIKSGSHNS